MRVGFHKWPFALLVGILGMTSVFAGSPVARALAVVATVPTGTNPAALAVNPSTNRIYVANYNSGNVTVIDGATHAKTNVPVGFRPGSLAVNQANNKIYAADWGGANNVTVIDGATNAAVATLGGF